MIWLLGCQGSVGASASADSGCRMQRRGRRGRPGGRALPAPAGRAEAASQYYFGVHLFVNAFFMVYSRVFWFCM